MKYLALQIGPDTLKQAETENIHNGVFTEWKSYAFSEIHKINSGIP